jgi:hypothetical protein
MRGISRELEWRRTVPDKDMAEDGNRFAMKNFGYTEKMVGTALAL